MRLADEASSRLHAVSEFPGEASSRLGALSRLPPLSLFHLLHTIGEGFRTYARGLDLGSCLLIPFTFGHCLGFGGHSSVTLLSLSLSLPAFAFWIEVFFC